MLPRWNRRAAFALLAGVLFLPACGGGDGGGAGGRDATFDAGSAEPSAPGSSHALGDRAFAAYDGLGAEAEPSVKTMLGVTVQEVKKGDSDDIEGLGSNTPYYVQVELENHGEGSIDGSVVSGHFTLRGSDDQDYSTTGVVSIGGDFEHCTRAEPQTALEPEQAILDCAIFALPEGVTPAAVLFTGDYASPDEPIEWAVGS